MAGAFRDFGKIRKSLLDAIPDIARFTDAETAAYREGKFSTYFAGKGLVTVFIDATERSPTFRLYPLDTVKEPREKVLDPGLDRSVRAGRGLEGFLGEAVSRP